MYLIDSNVFLNVLIYGEKFDSARRFLNENTGNVATTLVNIMEIFSILTRKYKWSKSKAVEIVDVIKRECKILIPNEYDFIDAYNLQKEYILTTNDALILSIARKENMILITFDKELLKYDGTIGKIQSI